MEKRRYKRKSVSLNAELISDGINYPGYIESISESGLHIIAASKKSVTSFIPEATIKLKLQFSVGGGINLHCEVRWVHINKTPIHGLTYRMGIEVLKQPPGYKTILKTV